MKLKITKTCSALAALSLALTLSTVARAEDDYCAKTMARAGSDAALMYAPSIRVEGVKLPSGLQQGGQNDPTVNGSTYQLRAGALLSPSNMYRGSVVQAVGRADCEAHRSATTAQELVANAQDLGRLGALRDQLRFLDEQKPVWDALEAKMRERLEAKTATLVEVEDVRAQIVLLERHRAQVRGEIDRLVAVGFDGANTNVAELSRKVQADANRLERERVRARAIDPWDVNLMGGYVPPVFSGTKSDWFGLIQFTYNLGGPWHGWRDDAYLDARERELKAARYEVPHQLDVLTKNVATAMTQARSELAILNARVAGLTATRAALVQSESSLAPHALAMLDLEIITANADKTFLEGLLRELGRIQEK